MTININNTMNSPYSKDHKLESRNKVQKISNTSIQTDTKETNSTVKLTNEAKALQILHDEIAKLPKSNDEKVQKLREKFLNGELYKHHHKNEAVNTYNQVADKLLAIDELL